MSLLQVEPAQILQPLLTRKVLQPHLPKFPSLWPCLCCIGTPKLNALSRFGLRSTTWSGTIPSLSLWAMPLLHSPGGCWLSLLPGHTMASHSAETQYHPEAFPTELLPRPLSSACPIAGTLPSLGQHLAFALADFHELPVSPSLQDPPPRYAVLNDGRLLLWRSLQKCNHTYKGSQTVLTN